MKHRQLISAIFSVLLFLFALDAAAQSNGTNGKALPKPRPFTYGEVLEYEGKFSKAILRGLGIADLTFTVENSLNAGDYLIKTEARSKGTLLKLLRYSFLQQYESTVDGDAFHALKTVKYDEQKERVRNSEAVFDYNARKVTYVETDPNEPARPPRRIASELPDKTHDIISGIYALRLLPLEVGKTFELLVSDSGLVYKIPVQVTGREKQKSVLGKKWCYRIEPEVFGDGRLVEQKGSMIIWVTDDNRRIPVRAQINSGLGKLEVKLRKYAAKSPSKK